MRPGRRDVENRPTDNATKRWYHTSALCIMRRYPRPHRS